MKKSWMLGLSLALFSMAACVKGPKEEIRPEANVTLTALTESPAATRTLVVDNDETTARVYWEPGDQFMAYSGGQQVDFYGRISEPCETAEFWGYTPSGPWVAGMDVWAIYPWNWETSFEDGVFKTVLPARQEARPGTFGREANLSIAHTTSGTIQFCNVGGGVRFSVQEEGIKEVIFQGLDGEYLAGKIQVGFQNEVPAVLDVVEGKHAISLVAPNGQTFEKDTWYYIVAIPGALEKGFALDFFKEDTHGGRVFDKSVTIKRSIYGTVTHADEGVSFTPCVEGIITFKDEKVRSILVSHFDVNGDKRISVREAAIVRSFLVNKAQTRADDDKVSIFAGTDITSFDELVYFTGLTRIEDGAFAGCEQLTSITIPETVTSIGANAFNGCTGLQSIIVQSPTPPAIGTDAFANSGDCPISVPEDVVDQYVSAWNEYAPRIKAAEEPVCPTPDAVDLGLPSGTKWASFNLGASKPEEYGDYYAWGETKTKSIFNWSMYKWYKSEGGSHGLTKYCPDSSLGFNGFQDGKWILDPEDDVAHVKLGESWRMPSAGEWDELARLCTLEWVSLGGVDCAKLTGPNGNSIILPPGGYAGDDADADNAIGYLGVFWSSSAVFADEIASWVFGFSKEMDEEDAEIPYPGRCLMVTPGAPRSYGLPVRPVSGPAPIFAESIVLDKTVLNLGLGETFTLGVSVMPENTTHKAMLWITENERIATVSSTGEMKGVGAGETLVYAVLMDGLKMAQCKVVVGYPEPIDLGLPSGVKWGSFNMGASKPEDYGDYFAWGETTTHYEPGGAQSDSPAWKHEQWSDYGEKSYAGGYDWRAYKFYMWDSQDLAKYCTKAIYGYDGFTDGKTVLDPEDDVAHVVFGGEWRTPSWAEMEELKNACTWEKTTQDGVNGYKVTGPNGNSIFLPAAGERFNTSLELLNAEGLYWTSSLYPTRPDRSVAINFDADGICWISGWYRRYGLTIRPVSGRPYVPVERVTLDKTEIVIGMGETVTLESAIQPGNACFSSSKIVSSSDNKVAKASWGSGDQIIVTGLAGGFATITVTALDGGKMATCDVTVLAVPEAVDLGLSVKWATFNLGASEPEGRGCQYAWGETKPKEYYAWSSYKWCEGTMYSLTKYGTDNKTVLDLEDDAAHVLLGGNWRMPTIEEWKELIHNCNWEWVTQNGTSGYRVTGRNENSIFIPAQGSSWTQYPYWSSSLDQNNPANYPASVLSQGVYLSPDISELESTRYYFRSAGNPIRPVSE